MPEPTSEAWAQIRYDYEHTDLPVEDICAAHGISSGTLRDRMRRWHWTRRRARIPLEGPPAVLPLPHSPSKTGVDAVMLGEGRDQCNGPAVSGDTTAPPDSDAAPIGARLQSAAASVLPALETTLARLAGAPMHPRQMEQVARALGSLTRTLRELDGLLVRYGPRKSPANTEELRESLARKLEALVAEEREDTPRRYLAGWNDFAAEAEGPSPEVPGA